MRDAVGKKPLHLCTDYPGAVSARVGWVRVGRLGRGVQENAMGNKPGYASALDSYLVGDGGQKPGWV